MAPATVKELTLRLAVSTSESFDRTLPETSEVGSSSTVTESDNETGVSLTAASVMLSLTGMDWATPSVPTIETSLSAPFQLATGVKV